jgi:hypothetical protein
MGLRSLAPARISLGIGLDDGFARGVVAATGSAAKKPTKYCTQYLRI